MANGSDVSLTAISNYTVRNDLFQVEVEALWMQGPKLATVMSQVKKLDVSVLVLGQKKPSPLFTWWVFSILYSLTVFISF